MNIWSLTLYCVKHGRLLLHCSCRAVLLVQWTTNIRREKHILMKNAQQGSAFLDFSQNSDFLGIILVILVNRKDRKNEL